jgi:hypothetical protein
VTADKTIGGARASPGPGGPGIIQNDRKERSMTTLEQIKDTTTRSAISGALEASRASYEEIRKARNELHAMESSGVYAEGYVEDQRRQRAERVRKGVEARLEGARDRVGAARSALASKFERMAGVKPEQVAAAQSSLAMFMGDLRENPEQLLTAYEQSFDAPADRKAIEAMVVQALRVLPDDPRRGLLEANFEKLRERLEDRLPVEQREIRPLIGELERALEYLAHVEQVTTSAIRGLVDPRQSGNLTAFAKASVYEEELTGASPMQDAIPMTSAAA